MPPSCPHPDDGVTPIVPGNGDPVAEPPALPELGYEPPPPPDPPSTPTLCGFV